MASANPPAATSKLQDDMPKGGCDACNAIKKMGFTRRTERQAKPGDAQVGLGLQAQGSDLRTRVIKG
jgi:hypothetical protein